MLSMFLLPLAAAGQSVSGDAAQAAQLLAQQADPANTSQATSGVHVPLWRDSHGRVLVLKADQEAASDPAASLYSPLLPPIAGAGDSMAAGLQYGMGSLQAHAQISQRSWLNQGARVFGSEVGATYDAGDYSVGLSVGATSTPHRNVPLPRVLPGAAPGGLYSFDSSNQLNAHGRLALGKQTGVDLGASVGRVHLLPGNLLGVSVLDQKALSFGVDHGPLSGMLTGRTMQPEAGVPNSLYGDRRWNSIDLGVTWRLPWRGSLSVGAQNLWSSGTPANTPVGPEPDQSRTPYVQYHQDL